MLNTAIWITWENQRRNRELAKALNIKLFELQEIDQISNPPLKYFLGLIKTFSIICRERPKYICCQNPSLILSCFLVLLKGVFGFKVYVDAHNAGLFPKEGRSKLLNTISRFVQRKADLVIVTNENLKQYVESNNGKGFVLPDKIPNIPHVSPQPLLGKVNILFICSYAEDEPYEEVFHAGRNIDPKVFIYVTGNYKKRGINPVDLPKNVILVGYIPETEYVAMLNSVDATIDLTTRENCLLCGAYESISVSKPMILSDTKALREYFSCGAVYTLNTDDSIRNAITAVIDQKAVLTVQIRELKSIRQKEWEMRKEELSGIIFS